MYEALQLAHGGLGWASPNPLVGCVLVRAGEIVGRGWHRLDGTEHAEVNALRAAGAAAQGSSCYVTLEPCSHVGRQPSCCRELARAGVARVVYGCKDTDRRTCGQADVLLPKLGVTVQGGVLRQECTEFLDYYLSSRARQQAFLHLKLALSLDAKVACANGNSQWLSGPESLGFAHYLRQKYDAVLVGYRTVLADDPRFTVRPEVLAAYRTLDAGVSPRHPLPVILDPELKLLDRLDTFRLWDAREPRAAGSPRVVLVTRLGGLKKLRRQHPQLAFIRLPAGKSGRMQLKSLAAELFALGIHSVLVEGGGGLAAELLRQQAVDRLSLVYTPKLIGREGIGFAPLLKSQSVADCPQLLQPQGCVLGSDVLLDGYLAPITELTGLKLP